MTVTLRRAAPGDFQAFCDLIPSADELFLVYPKGQYPFTVDQVADLLERRMEPTVLVREGAVIGFAGFYRYLEARSVFIGNLVIDPLSRGRGYARKIILHLLDLAFEKYDLPKVRISVFSHNSAALLLYASLGFKPYAIVARKDLGGNPVALLHLSLRRNAAPDSISSRSG